MAILVVRSLMDDLSNILLRINPMLRRFSVLGSLYDRDVHIKFSLPEYVDGRRYNKPTVEEVAAIIPTCNLIIPTCNLSTHRDIIVECKNNGSTRTLKRIYETNALYDPLAYPLIHLNGEQGWTLDLKQTDQGIFYLHNTISQKTYLLSFLLLQISNSPCINRKSASFPVETSVTSICS